MHERITIEQRTNAKDNTGSPIPTWTAFARVYADVRPLSGSERESFRLGKAEVTTQFRIRYKRGLLPTMRIDWRGKKYAISEVIDETARRAEMVVLAFADAVK